MTPLTPHFSLEEMTATSHGPNVPTPEIIANLTVTATGMERVREILGDQPIHVNSGYRSPAVNAAVGGVPTSAHLTGYACDFICPAFGAPLDICHLLDDSAFSFDQVIQEGTWVHISFAPTMRREVLTKDASGGYAQGL